MNIHSRFVAHDAKEARAEGPVPLLVGLTGPSGSGKTYSALRIATGIQSVVGGSIFVVDTEQRRSLHYAENFTFQHVDFQAPFGSLDYLEALRFCKSQGAGVVVIDSCSHEHDGPGGMLEQHEVELNRMAGDDYKKRDRMAMLAWQKPKSARRKLINAITTELNMPVIFCFRAKKTTKPKPGQQPVDMGFTSIGADEWLFELALNALLLPGSSGFPTWQSEMPGEALAIKLPGQFSGLAQRSKPLDEAVGAHLAKWAAGTLGKGQTQQAESTPRRFQAQLVGGDPDNHEDGTEPDPDPNVNDQADDETAVRLSLIRERIENADTPAKLKAAEDEWLKACAAYDEPTVADVERMIAEKRAGMA